MDWARQCAVVIPCRNEAASIGKIVSAVRLQLPSVIVVDDGSTDDTAERAFAAGAETLRHPANQGKGAALRTGWQRARDRGFAWALTMDGDGQHAPEDISAFLACAETTGATLVVGNRMNGASAMPWLRRQVNRRMSRWLSNLTGVPLADSQCGFRLVNLEALGRLPLGTRQFEIESEVLVAFLRAGCKVEFVPIEVIYKSQASKIHPLRDSWRWLRWWRGQRRRN
jgi:glycosyltransferase involved in cell wall biosynthesis